MALTAGRRLPAVCPVFHRAVRGEHGAGPLVAAHDDFQQFFGGGEGSLRIPRSSRMSRGTVTKELHVLFAGAVERGFSEIIKQGVVSR